MLKNRDYYSDISWDTLPEIHFPNGMEYFIKNNPDLKPVVVHANFIVDYENKREALKAKNLWIVNEKEESCSTEVMKNNHTSLHNGGRKN